MGWDGMEWDGSREGSSVDSQISVLAARLLLELLELEPEPEPEPKHWRHVWGVGVFVNGWSFRRLSGRASARAPGTTGGGAGGGQSRALT